MKTCYQLMAQHADDSRPWWLRLPSMDLPGCISRRQGDAFAWWTRADAEQWLAEEQNQDAMRAFGLQFQVIERPMVVAE